MIQHIKLLNQNASEIHHNLLNLFSNIYGELALKIWDQSDNV
jgi:hypothetical protein